MKLFGAILPDVIIEYHCFFGITDTKLLIAGNSYVNTLTQKIVFVNCSQTLPRPILNVKCW